MSTSENPETPPLTRRQLRELRNTGATPIVGLPSDAPAEARVAEPAVAEPAVAEPAVAEPTPDATTPAEAEPAASAPVEPVVEEEPAPEVPAKKGGMLGGLFGRGKAEKAEEEPAAEEPAAAPAPVEPLVPATFAPPSSSDLGVTGLTRRQVRAQERIRTASVPVITPDLQPDAPVSHEEAPAAVADTATDAPAEESASTDSAETTDAPKTAGLEAIFRPAAPEEAQSAEEASVSTVNPALGSHLLAGDAPDISLPPSFDQLIERSTVATGSVSMPNALILSQTPTGVPLVGPVTATGEIIVTGTFELPEGLGSSGHVPGTTDGRDVDAVLLDGELPPASSPTPIAASAAISTVKQPGEIIRPPAPEKGSKLVIGLIITTGALAVAVAVALVLAFTTGVFG
ncbi:hypothetical protein [Microbacterium sp. SLBN-111]|uniref:hypothetical protein n=1 Tax=Microbacterium sp. SLBN-111 TaxID=3377733 RepID=UPI003C7717DA